MVSDVTIGTAVNQQQKTTGASNKLAEDFSQFLQLLTIQLQNQDPLSPMETNEFTNQLVAFTGVEQQINTNQKLDSLVALNLGNSLGASLGYVGLDVSYVSTEFYYDGEQSSTINYALDSEAVDAKIRVLDESGEIIFEDDIPNKAGNNSYEWDGTLKDGGMAEAGTYEIRIDALDVNDEAVGSTVVVSGTVTGVETQNGATFLIVGERAVRLGNILNAKQPVIGGDNPENVSEDNPENETDV